MSRKWVKIIATLIFSSYPSSYLSTINQLANLGPKTTKLYKEWFSLLEEQIGTLPSKNTILGLEKIEPPNLRYFEEGASQHSLNAYVRPTIYDKYGKQSYRR